MMFRRYNNSIIVNFLIIVVSLLMFVQVIDSSSIIHDDDVMMISKQQEQGQYPYRNHRNLIEEITLPEGFAIIESSTGHPVTLSLVWSPSSSSSLIRMSNARYEFRFLKNTINTTTTISNPYTIFGYPREVHSNNKNELHLSLKISMKQQDQLIKDGMNLQVWKSGIRIDGTPTSRNSPQQQQQQLQQTSRTYDSKPPSTPKINVNPAKLGNYAIRRLSYSLPPINISLYPVPIEVVGEVYQPRNVTSTYQSPLVLILHGRHSTCYSGLPRENNNNINWPCRFGYQPIPSHLGYRYVGNVLASQGYIVVSIAANAINAQDNQVPDYGVGARSTLIRHHLNLFAKWNTIGGDPWNSILRGKIDMTRVVLVGHSRGGEGVHRAAIDVKPTDPYKVVGLVSYGPTAFGAQVTPDVHSLTILPTCDGDVSDFQGQIYIDRSRDIAYSEALRTAVTALGCNHNYFNMEWTPGLSKAFSEDDWLYFSDSNDPVCGIKGSVRLTAQEQQVVGVTYTAAFIRFAVYQDKTMLPLLDGSFVRPVSIGRAEVATSAVGGAAYRLLYVPGVDTVQKQNGMIGSTCVGYSGFGTVRECGNNRINSPHFIVKSAPSLLVYELSWTEKIGAIARFSVRTNLTGYDWIDFRIGNDPNKSPVRFDIVVSDRNGKNATLPLNLTTIDGWPGTGNLDRMQARTFRGRFQSSRLRTVMDITRITDISLVTRTASGRVWILDIAASRTEIIQPTELNLPVVSVENVVVKEGIGTGTSVVRVRVTPKPMKPGVVWLFDYSTFESYPLNISVGSPTGLQQFPASWVGNDVYNQYGQQPITAASIVATKGVLTGNYIGGLQIAEDDRVPILSVVGNTNITVVEGTSLRWTLKLSAPTDGMEYLFEVLSGSNELYSNDVPDSWLDSVFSTAPTTPVPISRLYISLYIRFAYGESGTTKEIVIPTVKDGTAEPDESITLRLYNFNTPTDQPDIVLVGTVRTHST